jgi:hypothetical protein
MTFTSCEEGTVYTVPVEVTNWTGYQGWNCENPTELAFVISGTADGNVSVVLADGSSQTVILQVREKQLITVKVIDPNGDTWDIASYEVRVETRSPLFDQYTRSIEYCDRITFYYF